MKNFILFSNGDLTVGILAPSIVLSVFDMERKNIIPYLLEVTLS
jgi:hypothetical protein